MIITEIQILKEDDQFQLPEQQAVFAVREHYKGKYPETKVVNLETKAISFIPHKRTVHKYKIKLVK